MQGRPKTEIHYGYDGELSFLADLEGRVVHFVGLSSRSLAVPGGFSGDPKDSERLLITEIARLYNFPTNVDASHQTIGIFSGGGSNSPRRSLSNYNPSDITQYFQGQIPGNIYNTPPNLVPISLAVDLNHYLNDPTIPTLELT
jgi:kumamolisin